MIYTIRGLLLFTVFSAVSCVIAVAAGVEWAFGSAVVWLPILATMWIHRSAPSRFHRNIGLLVPSTLLCWLAVCGGYLAVSRQLGWLNTHEVFIESFALIPTACTVGCMHGLCISIGYCVFLNYRYRLSEEIRPLNGNDLTTRSARYFYAEPRILNPKDNGDAFRRQT